MMAAAAAALSFGLVEADTRLGVEAVRDFGWLYTFGPEGARSVLSAIASSMITVAGLTFSITMLTLQLASSQFGPRLLRNFLRDRGNQIVLGTFIATFVYCLLVLRTVRGTEGSSFVPHVSVAAGVVFAIASLAVLIYFIHHTAFAIRIETLLAELAAETHAAVDRLYPERLGHEPPRHAEPFAEGLTRSEFDRDSRPVPMSKAGYVQVVDADALIGLAVKHDLLVQVVARPGRFVAETSPVVVVHPGDHLTEEVRDALRAAVIVGAERTPQQDLEFSIRRIVEIAQRALSPGINDPTTALYCIDRLGETLTRLAERDPPSPVRFDEAGQARIVTETDTLADLACPALAAIARYGSRDADVLGRLLAALSLVIQAAKPAERARLVALREAIRADAERNLTLNADRQVFQP